MVNVVPANKFREIAETLKTEVSVTSYTQSGRYTRLYFDVTSVTDKQYLKFDCGDLQGYYEVRNIYTDSVEIPYSGSVTIGTVKKAPFFMWGNLKDGKESLLKLNEFPMIYFILPTPYGLNLEESELEFIEHNFKFLIIDKITRPDGSEKTKTDEILDEVVEDMSQLALDFAQAIKDDKDIIKGATFNRSEEIPFSVTFSGANGNTESLIAEGAGCYLEASVRINKKYNC